MAGDFIPEVAQKYKMAKSFAKDYLITKGNIKDGNFNLPSGTTVEDVIKYVIDKMFAVEESEHDKRAPKVQCQQGWYNTINS